MGIVKTVLICLVTLFGFMPSGFAADSLDIPEIRTILAKDVATVSPESLKIIETGISKNSPLLIFVPGILGSELKANVKGKISVIWGKSSFKENQDTTNALIFCSGKEVTAHPLAEFDISYWKNEPVYREWFKTLEKSKEKVNLEYHLFSYDWRQKIGDIADTLNKEIDSLRGKKITRDRPIIFVTHSMGGLVLSWWYHGIYANLPQDKKLNIVRTLIVGAPLGGSAAMAKVLMSGYMGDSFAKIAVKSLNRVGHTFPSIYQLLPYPKYKLFVDSTGKPLDHFDAGIWTNNSLFRTAPEPLIYCKDREDLKLSKLLENGKNFHTKMDEFFKAGQLPRTSYFYGQHRYKKYETIECKKRNDTFCNTPLRMTVKKAGEHPWTYTSGDGRVIPMSATFREEGDNASQLVDKHLEHGSLLNNTDILNKLLKVVDDLGGQRDRYFVENFIAPSQVFASGDMQTGAMSTLAAAPTSGAASKGQNIAAVKAVFEKNGILFKLPEEDVKQAISKSQMGPVLSATLSHNVKILNNRKAASIDKPFAGSKLFDLARRTEGDGVEARKTRQRLYSLIAAGLVKAPKLVTRDAALSVQHLAIEDNQFFEAKKWNEQSAPLFTGAPKTKREMDQFKAYKSITKWVDWKAGLIKRDMAHNPPPLATNQ